MMARIDKKSMVLGAALGAGLFVLIGAARNEWAGPVGRYQACCSQNSAYLVDTITGQVWLNSEREFRAPKLRTAVASEAPAVEKPTIPSPTVQRPAAQAPTVQSPAPAGPPAARTPAVEAPRTEARPTPSPTGFIGKWILKHPTEGEFSIQIQSSGRAVLSFGDQTSEGKWKLEGNQITITTERESMTAQMDDQGRLMVKQGDGEPIAFQQAP